MRFVRVGEAANARVQLEMTILGIRGEKLDIRLAQPTPEIGTLPGTGGVTQFDLPRAPLAPGEYYLLFTLKGSTGPVGQRISFMIMG